MILPIIYNFIAMIVKTVVCLLYPVFFPVINAKKIRLEILYLLLMILDIRYIIAGNIFACAIAVVYVIGTYIWHLIRYGRGFWWETEFEIEQGIRQIKRNTRGDNRFTRKKQLKLEIEQDLKKYEKQQEMHYKPGKATEEDLNRKIKNLLND